MPVRLRVRLRVQPIHTDSKAHTVAEHALVLTILVVHLQSHSHLHSTEFWHSWPPILQRHIESLMNSYMFPIEGDKSMILKIKDQVHLMSINLDVHKLIFSVAKVKNTQNVHLNLLHSKSNYDSGLYTVHSKKYSDPRKVFFFLPHIKMFEITLSSHQSILNIP